MFNDSESRTPLKSADEMANTSCINPDQIHDINAAGNPHWRHSLQEYLLLDLRPNYIYSGVNGDSV